MHFRRLSSLLAPGRLGGQMVAAIGLRAWTAAVSFALSLIIARSFGAAGTGYYGIAVSSVTILSYIVLAGLDYMVVRTAAGDLREGRRDLALGAVLAALRAVALTAPLVVGALWLGRDWVAREVLGQPEMADLLGIALWATVPLALQRIASSALRVSGRVIASQVIDGPLGSTCAIAGLLALVWLRPAAAIEVPFWFYLGGLTIGAASGLLLLRGAVRGWPRAAPVVLLPLVAAGLPVVGSNIANVFTEWYTTVALGQYWSAAVVGQYRVAWQFVALAGLLQVAMDTMIGPRIAAAARVGARDEIAAVARKAVALVLAMGAPLFIVLLALPETLLGLFGSEFVGGALALQILAGGQLVRLASGPLGSILFMTGNQRWMLAYAAAGVVLCVVFVALLVPAYGVVGAAVATVATVVLRNVAAGIVVHRVLGINLFRRPRATPLP